MLERGRYGVERFRRPTDEKSGGVGCVFAIVMFIALVSLAWTLVARYRAHAVDHAEDEAVRLAALSNGPEESEEPERTAQPESEQPPAPPPEVEPPVPPPETPAAPQGLATEDFVKRPVRLRNLLLRLDEAGRSRNTEMLISTIEEIRALPGAPAADLDDALARRLGALNLKRLFIAKNRQWVKTVEVRRGDSASRIASEHGSTLASLKRLNGGKIDALRIGSKLAVMDHPRFSLVVRRRVGIADLSLNGKFFKRYDLASPVTGKHGRYDYTLPARAFWASLGIHFKPDDRVELEMMLPKGVAVLITEM